MFEQTFVDTSQVPFAQAGIFEGSRAAAGFAAEGKRFQGISQKRIGNAPGLQRGIIARLKQTTVVARDIQTLVAVAVVTVDKTEQTFEPLPENKCAVVRVLSGGFWPGKFSADRLDTKGLYIRCGGVRRQKITGFRVKHEQDTVKKNQRVIENRG